MLDIEKKFVLGENIVLRGIKNKFWALDVTSGSQFKLNETAYFILKCFEQPVSINYVIECVMKQYVNVNYDQLKNDCESVIDFASGKNILKEVAD